MIKLTNINKRYDYSLNGVFDITYTFNDTGLYFLEGTSGCGKTTLLNILGGIDIYDEGSYNFWGKELRNLNEEELEFIRSNYIGYIFQDFKLFENLTVYENIAISCHNTNEEYLKDIDSLLEKLDIIEFKNKYVKNLSAGQKQRTAIARALIKRPRVILADEPTGNLDSESSKQVMNILKEISKEYLVIVVSHDHQLVEEYANYSILMKDGKIVNCFTYGSFGIQDSNKEIEVQKPKISLRNFIAENTKLLKHSFAENASVCIIFFFVCILLSLVFGFTSFNQPFAQYNVANVNNENYVLAKYSHEVTNGNITFEQYGGYKYYQQKDSVDFISYYEDKLIDKTLSSEEQESYPNVYVATYKEDLNLELISGTYPTNENDILISDYTYNQLNELGTVNSLEKSNYDINICGVYRADIDTSIDTITEDTLNVYLYGAYMNDVNVLNNLTTIEINNSFVRNGVKQIVNTSENISGSLVSGRLPTNHSEVVINKTMYDYYYGANQTALPISYDVYDIYIHLDSDDISRDLSLYLVDSNITIVGVYDDSSSSHQIYLESNDYKTFRDVVFKYFETTYMQVKTDYKTFKLLMDNDFVIVSCYSSSISNFIITVRVILAILIFIGILLIIFSVSFLRRDLQQLFIERKQIIGTLLSIGVSKKELYFAILSRYILLVVLLFGLSLIVNIPLYQFVNKMIGLVMFGDIYPTIITVNYGLNFVILITVLVIVVWTAIKGLKKIKNNDVVYWMKNDK